MMGIFYAAPLLGPSIGPLFGGVLSQVWSWRATFYFLSIIGGIVLLSIFLFKDTFRKERSLNYQSAKRRAIQRQERTAKEEQGIVIFNSGQAEEVETKDKQGDAETVASSNVRVTLRDLNLFKPIWNILKRRNNYSMILTSG
jgi:MFS family permease